MWHRLVKTTQLLLAQALASQTLYQPGHTGYILSSFYPPSIWSADALCADLGMLSRLVFMLLLVAMENFSCWYLEKLLQDFRIHSAHMTPEGTNRHKSAVEPQADKSHRKHLVCTGMQHVMWSLSVLLSSQRGDTNE